MEIYEIKYGINMKNEIRIDKFLLTTIPFSQGNPINEFFIIFKTQK